LTENGFKQARKTTKNNKIGLSFRNSMAGTLLFNIDDRAKSYSFVWCKITTQFKGNLNREQNIT